MDFELSLSVTPPLQPLQPLQPLRSPIPLPADAPPSMPLPPEAIYSSKEELYTSIQAWAAPYHYAFHILQSKKINNGLRTRILYGCDWAGPPPPEKHPQSYLQDQKRYIATRKTNCQFSVIAIQHTDIQWELRHRPGTAYSVHNHPPSQSASSHPIHCKLAQPEINQARSLYTAGIKPAQAITYLRQTSLVPV